MITQIRLMFTLFGLLGFTACAVPSTNITQKPHNVLAIGDSLTARPGSFVDLAAQSQGWNLTNEAVSGTVSSQIFAVVESTNLGSYDSVIYLAGANDMREYGSNTLIFQQNLQKMLQLFAQAHLHVYLGTTMRFLPFAYNDPSEAPFNNGSDAATVAYANVIRAYAAQYNNVTVFDVNTQFIPSALTIGPDQVHPNNTGFTDIEMILLSVIN